MSDPLTDVMTVGGPESPISGPALPSADGVAHVSEAGTVGRLALRASAQGAEVLGGVLSSALAGRVNTATIGEGCIALRLGPDEWLMLADADSDPWLAARIADAAKDVAVSLTDVSHRTAGIVLSGPAVETVLSVGCPLPLDLEHFPVGRATRTIFAKAEIVLWRQAADRFQVEVARSFAPYVVALLTVAIEDEVAIAAASRAQTSR